MQTVITQHRFSACPAKLSERSRVNRISLSVTESDTPARWIIPETQAFSYSGTEVRYGIICANNPIMLIDPWGLCGQGQGAQQGPGPSFVIVYVQNRQSSIGAVLWYNATSQNDAGNPNYIPGHAATQVITPNGSTSIVGTYPDANNPPRQEPDRDWSATQVFPVTPAQAQAATIAQNKPGFSKFGNDCVDHVSGVLNAATIPHPSFSTGPSGDPAKLYQWVADGAPPPPAYQYVPPPATTGGVGVPVVVPSTDGVGVTGWLH